jgi:hypothetical protein
MIDAVGQRKEPKSVVFTDYAASPDGDFVLAGFGFPWGGPMNFWIRCRSLLDRQFRQFNRAFRLCRFNMTCTMRASAKPSREIV